ncbi:MAG: hypothetical protein RL417_520, partial [Pseudomonadota bacterium]
MIPPSLAESLSFIALGLDHLLHLLRSADSSEGELNPRRTRGADLNIAHIEETLDDGLVGLDTPHILVSDPNDSLIQGKYP